MKLEIELVPQSTWGWNLRSELTRSQWDRIRRDIYERAGHCCEVCGGRGTRHPVECHEKWIYREFPEPTQFLVGLEALCPKCHMVRHLGLTFSRGLGHVALSHIMKVNGISLEDSEELVRQAFTKWQTRNRLQWSLDLTWLTQHLATLE
jgi:hypothetical protein